MIKNATCQYLSIRHFGKHENRLGWGICMKNNESVTKLAQAIARLRKFGLTVTDETPKGGSIGIAGVRDRSKEGEVAEPVEGERLPAEKQ
jgi:hypothetical protein